MGAWGEEQEAGGSRSAGIEPVQQVAFSEANSGTLSDDLLRAASTLAASSAGAPLQAAPSPADTSQPRTAVLAPLHRRPGPASLALLHLPRRGPPRGQASGLPASGERGRRGASSPVNLTPSKEPGRGNGQGQAQHASSTSPAAHRGSATQRAAQRDSNLICLRTRAKAPLHGTSLEDLERFLEEDDDEDFSEPSMTRRSIRSSWPLSSCQSRRKQRAGAPEASLGGAGSSQAQAADVAEGAGGGAVAGSAAGRAAEGEGAEGGAEEEEDEDEDDDDFDIEDFLLLEGEEGPVDLRYLDPEEPDALEHEEVEGLEEEGECRGGWRPAVGCRRWCRHRDGGVEWGDRHLGPP